MERDVLGVRFARGCEHLDITTCRKACRLTDKTGLTDTRGSHDTDRQQSTRRDRAVRTLDTEHLGFAQQGSILNQARRGRTEHHTTGRRGPDKFDWT
jgi:hypothetical protein